MYSFNRISESLPFMRLPFQSHRSGLLLLKSTYGNRFALAKFDSRAIGKGSSFPILVPELPIARTQTV
jgi:hypothetical protein